MYWLSGTKKRDPHILWGLPDRIFFGRGACHILAGAYLEAPPLPGFWAERIVPAAEFSGGHIYLTDGEVAFDFHGYALRHRLLTHHARGWAARYPGWSARMERVDFGLLDREALNARKMLGPDQYLHDPVERARRFIGQIDHPNAVLRARRRASDRTRAAAPPAAAERALEAASM